jgi:hypothetical protein
MVQYTIPAMYGTWSFIAVYALCHCFIYNWLVSIFKICMHAKLHILFPRLCYIPLSNGKLNKKPSNGHLFLVSHCTKEVTVTKVA